MELSSRQYIELELNYNAKIINKITNLSNVGVCIFSESPIITSDGGMK